MRLTVKSLHVSFLLVLSGQKKTTAQKALRLVQHVLLRYATINRVCSHLKMKALAKHVTAFQILPVADRAVTASAKTTIKNRYLLMCVRESEIKEREAFVFVAAQRLNEGESPGKNLSANSHTTRRQDHLARA